MQILLLKRLLMLRHDKRGVTIIEYALLAALIAVALVGALGTLQGSISTELSTVGASL